jgi:hypothetical protein
MSQSIIEHGGKNMTTGDRRRKDETLAAEPSGNGSGSSAPPVTHCAFCGVDLDSGGIIARRFGETFCDEAHAEAFVSEARAARVEAAARARLASDGDRGASAAAPQDGQPASGRWDLKRMLKLGACCGLPLLALVFLAGGGGALLGGAAAILPTLALLACPVGMFFMMRAMQGHDRSQGGGESKGSGSKGPDGPASGKEQ